MANLDSMNHVAIPAQDIAATVDWYTKNFRCEVRYQDATWALLAFGNIHLALVTPGQHPPHLGFVTTDAARFGELKTHRDGTKSCYISDPAGNAVEMLAANSMPAN